MNAILVFECAGRTGNFSQAARLLGTSQPSVSRHITNLEAVLGCKLFDRKNNRLALTTAGERLHRAARSGLDALNAVIVECQAEATSKVITIGCTHGFAHLWIMPRFSSLQSLFPDQEIRIVTSETSQDFDPEDLDFSIRMCNAKVSNPPGLHLFDEEVFLVVSPAFRKSHHAALEGLDLDKLQQVPLIHLDDGAESGVSWLDWFADQGLSYHPPEGSYVYRNYAFSLQAAAEGKGVALAWNQLLGSYLTNGWLETLEYPVLKTPGSYRLVCREALAEHEVGQRISAWFQEALLAHPDAVSGSS